MLIILQALAMFLMWCAFKPIGASLLVFVATACWMPIISKPTPISSKTYWYIYLLSAIAWLALFQGIRLAYWPLYIGWVALSIYVAIWVPVFIVVSRYLVHRWSWPLALAAPLTWIGCDLLRCYVLTGFGGCLLAHTLAERPALIQLAAHIGPHGVGGLIVLVGVAIYQWTAYSISAARPAAIGQREPLSNAPDLALSKRQSIIAPLLSTVAIAGFFGFSAWMYFEGKKIASSDSAKPLLRVALIQEVAETRFEYNPERAQTSWERYSHLSAETLKDDPSIDVIVWPESIYSLNRPYIFWDGGEIPNLFANMLGDPRDANRNAAYYSDTSSQQLKDLRIFGDTSADAKPVALILGASYWEVVDNKFQQYNSVLFASNQDRINEVYNKRNLVMYGEYIPLADIFPAVYDKLQMSPLGRGKEWKIFEINGVRIAPSICFEDMLPQVMQDQVANLTAAGQSPDALVCVTNDGWFRGSSMLDHHFACAVFTAVENRRPMLVSANTGISTWVSGNGDVMKKSQRMRPEAIIASPIADARWGLWQVIGDWPARLIAMGVFSLFVATCFDRTWLKMAARSARRQSDL